MPNNNVAIISLMAKFDEKSIEDAAKKLGKTTEEALNDIDMTKFDQGLLKKLDDTLKTIEKKLKGVNLSSYMTDAFVSLSSKKDIEEKTKDLQKFIDNISNLSKSLSGLNPNSLNSLSNTKQLDAVIAKQEKILAKEQEIAQKREQLEGTAKNVSKQKRSVNTISKNYLVSDFEKSSESLKKLFSTENGLDKVQEKSIGNLSKMLTLYSDMEKIEPKKGTTEAIKYSTDLLTVVKEIKETASKIDLFTGGKSSKFISDNFDSVNKVSEYNVKLSQQEYVKNELKSLNAQKSKLEKSLADYIADTVRKNLQKNSNEADRVIDKATQKADKLQQKIDSLKGNTDSGKPIITNIVDESQVKSLEEIEDRLYEIYDKDSDGEATNNELKEFIQLYKQYEQLISKDDTVKSDPELKTEYEYILKSSNSLKKYSDQLDETIAKQKESTKANILNSAGNGVVEQLSKQKEEIKETIEAEQDLSNVQKTNSNIDISVNAKQALEDINAIKESLESIPNEKKISISVENTDYSSTPLLSDEEGNVVTAFRGVTNAWSGLINQDGIGFFTDKLKLAADYADSLAESGKVFQANLSFHNPLEIEGNGAKWNEIDFEGVKHTTDEIIQIAKNLGYDGVIFKNIRDGFSDTEEDISNVMVALNAAQIKNEQVVGAVKAGTGELVNVASNTSNVSDNITASVVDSQNKIQSELKETEIQADKTTQAVKDVATVTPKEQKKDAFPGSSTDTKPEAQGMEQIEKATKEAAQAKKDFATANEGVQSSIDDSENPLKLEAELMAQIAKSAREAADAKKEFVEANKQVKDSAKKGNNDLANSHSGSAETSGNKNHQQKSNKDDNKLIQEQIKNLQKLSAEKQKAAESERKSTVNQASKDQLEAWKQIQRIRKEISNTSNSKIIEQLNQEKQTYQEQYLAATKILKNNSDLYNSEQRLNELKKISLSTTKQIESSQQTQLNGYDQKLSSYNSKVGNYDATINKFDNGGWTSSEYLEKVQKAKDILLEYEKEVNNLKNNPELVSKESLANVENLGKEFENVTSEIKNMSAPQKGYSLVSGQKELDKIRQILKENSAMSSDAKAKIKAYYKEIESGNPSMSLDKIHGEIMKIVNAEAEAGRAGKRMWDAIKEKAWYGVASTIGTYFGLNDVFRYIGQGISTIRELDTALTEMKKVSNETEQSLKNYQATTFDTADAVGTTAKQIQNSTADWMRLGESMDQAAKSAKDATILLNVSEFEGIDEATDALVSMSQAYKDIDKMDIIDVLNNVGNNYSISTDGLATALKDSASALVTANNDLNEAVALTTAGKLITCIYRNIYNRMNLIAGNALEPCTTI